MVLLSIVIRTTVVSARLIEIIRGLVGKKPPVFCEVIVIGSGDNAPGILLNLENAAGPGTTLIYRQSPLPSATLQRNIGALRASGEYILMLDDDVEIEDPSILQEMVDTLRWNKKIAAIVGCMVTANPLAVGSNTLQSHFYRFVRRVFFVLERETGHFTVSCYPQLAPHGAKKEFVECASLGALFLIKSGVFRTFLLDSALAGRAPWEDVILTWHMGVLRKLKILRDPNLKFHHIFADGLATQRVAEALSGHLHFFRCHVLPHRPLRTFALSWSLVGLFFLALYGRGDELSGFLAGLYMTKRGRHLVGMV